MKIPSIGVRSAFGAGSVPNLERRRLKAARQAYAALSGIVRNGPKAGGGGVEAGSIRAVGSASLLLAS
jgi:hypothetical protein